VRIRAVLFDLDNTLFDHRASARAGLEAFLRHLQATPSPDLASSWFEIEQRSYDRFLSKEISFQEQRRERLRQFLPMIGLTGPLEASQLDDLFVTYLQNYERAWTAFRDARPRCKSCAPTAPLSVSLPTATTISKLRKSKGPALVRCWTGCSARN
jgi:putative hydrolase of the HAD superfamily